MAKTVIASTCRECSVRCGSLVYLQDGKVVKITGNPGHPGPLAVAGAVSNHFVSRGVASYNT